MIKPSNRASIRNISDYSPFGVQLAERTISGDGYRFGFQGQEMDGEFGGSGNSIDFGARMYDPRLGRMRSLDAFASKYPAISPYAFVANNPISNIEMGGDSVLFYSSSGKYLGYSNDNQRYKGKNLLVIIDDKDLKNFRETYQKKRMLPNLTLEQKEAHVAGLEGMGQSFDITAFVDFYNTYEDKQMKDGKPVPYDPKVGPVEWTSSQGNKAVNSNDKGGSVAPVGKATSDNSPSSVEWPSRSQGYGDFHIHTSGLIGEGPSTTFDYPRANNVAKNDNSSPFSILVSGDAITIYRYKNAGTDQTTGLSNEPSDLDVIQINRSSFKKAK
jgi:RHS repeat-associated protein